MPPPRGSEFEGPGTRSAPRACANCDAGSDDSRISSFQRRLRDEELRTTSPEALHQQPLDPAEDGNFVYLGGSGLLEGPESRRLGLSRGQPLLTTLLTTPPPSMGKCVDDPRPNPLAARRRLRKEADLGEQWFDLHKMPSRRVPGRLSCCPQKGSSTRLPDEGSSRGGPSFDESFDNYPGDPSRSRKFRHNLRTLSCSIDVPR